MGEKFDGDVVAALQEFQKRYSLEADGVVEAKIKETRLKAVDSKSHL